MLNEAEIIAKLQATFPQYIGDDGAVLLLSENQRTVITKDLLVEDVHFRTKYCDPASLAHKALHVNLSDLAAMGAHPQFILLGISIPPAQEAYAARFLKNFEDVCKIAYVMLIGGDTTASPDKFFISITAVGVAHPARIKYRHTAHPGDLICVAGALGHAHLGLRAFETEHDGLEVFKDVFLYPIARVAEGRWLGTQTGVQSMMDLSDGLHVDLKRLCRASGVGAEINLENLFISDHFTAACKAFTLDPVHTALTGGEDYGLLFTVHPQNYSALAPHFRKTFGYDLKHIGRMTSGDGVTYLKQGKLQNLHLSPFEHFRECS